jgi:molybdopterin/thiamine biosynthesis adenylyltransferase
MSIVHIAGCGAIGTHIASQLVTMEEIKELHLYDFDTVELRNVAHRLRLKHYIGMKKVDALKTELLANFSHRIPAQNIILHHGDILNCSNLNGLVIDCLDNYEARKFTTKFNTLHVGFNPIPTGLVHWNDNYDVPEVVSKTDPCDKQELYVFLNLLASVACFSIQDKKNYIVSRNLITKIS